MIEDTRTSRRQKAAQSLREARDHLERIPVDEADLGDELTIVILRFIEEAVMPSTKGGSRNDAPDGQS